jgi:hypothetical protein
MAQTTKHLTCIPDVSGWILDRGVYAYRIYVHRKMKYEKCFEFWLNQLAFCLLQIHMEYAHKGRISSLKVSSGYRSDLKSFADQILHVKMARWAETYST